MKILFCLNHFLPDKLAGTEIYVEQLISRLKVQGIQAQVIIPNFYSNVEESYLINDIPVVKFPETSLKDRRLFQRKRKTEGVKFFTEIVARFKPDIIHFHELSGSLGFSDHHIIAVKNLGIKVVFTYHLAGYSCINGLLRYKARTLCNGRIDHLKCTKCYVACKTSNALTSKLVFLLSYLLFLVRIDTSGKNAKLATALGLAYFVHAFERRFMLLNTFCDRIVVLNNWYAEILRMNKVPPQKITVCVSASPVDVYAEISVSAIPKHALHVIYEGRICFDKGVHLLIRAIAGLPHHLIYLDIYGNADEPDYVHELKSQTKNNNRIGWKGILERNNVIPTFKNYDILCIPSLLPEMSPLVIHEAATAGLPVLASDCLGNKELIEQYSNGLLFRSGNIQSLKTQLIRCCENKDLLQKNFSKKNVVQRTFKDVASEHLRIYNEVME